jgi:hypothetical protein
MTAAKALIQGFTHRLLPQAFIDDRDDAKPVRLKRYGEVNVSEFDNNLYGYAEEGSFFVATNPTVGTGLTWGFAAAWQSALDTSPLVFISNDEIAGGKSLYLAWIKLITTAATTTTTTVQFAGVVDTIPRAITTDNMLAIVPVNPNSAASATASCTVKVQNSATASAIAAKSGASRRVCRGVLGGFPVIGDEMVISFGRGNQHGHPGLTAAEAAAPRKSVSSCPPVVLAPGQNFTLNVWFPAITLSAINPEVEIAFWAR